MNLVFRKNQTKKVSLENFSTIFVILPDGIGDLVYWIPILRFIAKSNPEITFYFPFEYEKFDAICGTSQLNAKKVEYVDNKNKSHFELAFLISDDPNILNHYREILNKTPIRLGLLGGRNRDQFLTHFVKKPLLNFGKHELIRNERIINLFEDYKDYSRDLNIEVSGISKNILDYGSYVVIHPFSRGHGREWRPDFYLTLIKKFINIGLNIVITGTDEERQSINNLLKPILEDNSKIFNLAGNLQIDDLLHILKNAKLTIASSTGPLHLSAALGSNCIGIYAPRRGLSPKRWGPIGENSFAISYKNCRIKRCDNSNCACINKVLPEHVFNFSLNLFLKDCKINHKDFAQDQISLWNF